jgi:hypothetical protein
MEEPTTRGVSGLEEEPV